jgi:aspartate-semialdehyde dehydrogenase
MNTKLQAGILGATGMVGQQFIRFLENHPWFEVTWLGASERSAGKTYAEAAKWNLSGAPPERIAGIRVSAAAPDASQPIPKLLFSAMDASVATEIERAFAQAGHIVVSNSRNHRMEPDIPLLVPEVNGDHLRVLAAQRRRWGWTGAIVTNPNCSTITLTMALGALRPFGIQRVIATTMQAVSGAGYPGVPSMDILGNVVPYIGGEEEKMEQETQKILGVAGIERIVSLDARVSAHCNRVAVIDGHTVTVSVQFERKPSASGMVDALRAFRGLPQEKNLPSAPARPVQYLEEPDRPQPRRDAERDNGMACFVGRLRECPVLDWKFVALAHNTIRGAAGAAVLNAELMLAEGILD